MSPTSPPPVIPPGRARRITSSAYLVLLAFSLQDQVEKYGAYVGIASFFGLAVLSLLYFAQAREVKRLREWAGRAPEALLDLEARFATLARAPAPAPAPPPPAPVPEVAVATNG